MKDFPGPEVVAEVGNQRKTGRFVYKLGKDSGLPLSVAHELGRNDVFYSTESVMP